MSRFIHRFYCVFNLSIRIDCTCRSFFTVVSTLSDRSTSRLIFCLCFFLITGIWNSRWHQVLLIYITDTLWYGYGTLAILRSTFNLFSKIVRFAPVFVLWFARRFVLGFAVTKHIVRYSAIVSSSERSPCKPHFAHSGKDSC